MRVSDRFKRYYHTLRDINYAVFGVVATVAYTAIYMFIVPCVWILSPGRKKISHTAWNKWLYKSETLEDVRKQY